ncbi:unnamed protein product [Closterium sp. NIES-54]
MRISAKGNGANVPGATHIGAVRISAKGNGANAPGATHIGAMRISAKGNGARRIRAKGRGAKANGAKGIGAKGKNSKVAGATVLMMERGLRGFFDGTEKKSDDESDIAAWKKKDQKAFATLISRIGINLVSSVRMCIKLEASAHEAWKRLETIHVNKTLHGKILARNAFYTVKMRAGESMHEYATMWRKSGKRSWTSVERSRRRIGF